jgi:hypothetical protein
MKYEDDVLAMHNSLEEDEEVNRKCLGELLKRN